MNIFKNVNTIKVIPENITLENNFISAELTIIVNGAEELKVVDLIEFDKDKNITSIKAFKG